MFVETIRKPPKFSTQAGFLPESGDPRAGDSCTSLLREGGPRGTRVCSRGRVRSPVPRVPRELRAELRESEAGGLRPRLRVQASLRGEQGSEEGSCDSEPIVPEHEWERVCGGIIMFA